MSEYLIPEKSPKIPTDPRARKRLEQAVAIGDLDELVGVPLPLVVPRFLVTYMNSVVGGRIRSATVVSVTNRSEQPARVVVRWYKGFSDDNNPVGTTAFSIPADYTVDFSSRNIPFELTTVNSVCNPELVFDEGRAVVLSSRARIGVSSRVYYTSGDKDEQLLAITDSEVVRYATGNSGE
ncbi:MAG TPA: hypothetical protein VFJ85_17145 [Acidimicrobiales bacterium]|nr:hypothetical protein [Acidimicrobiales bacterium]